MELAAVVEKPTIGEATAREDLRALALEPAKVPEDPRLPIAQEALDAIVGTLPAAAAFRRDGHHETAPRVDGQA
jgi:hypothetical protein